MHPGAKRKRCPSLEDVDLDQQQQILFDVSVLKLQQEQLRHGVEPRLLRFVLINNALRDLQGHMLQLTEGNDRDLLGSFDCDPFLCNTFRKHGMVSSAPPTPAKVLKLDTTAFNDQSLLAAARPCSVTEGESVGSEGVGEKRPVNSLAVVNQSCTNHLGKHALHEEETWATAGKSGEKAAESGEGERKKACHSHLNGTKLNGTSGLYSMLEHLPPPTELPPLSTTSSSRDEEEEERSSTPSPIDFTKVDPSLYDFDTRTTLSLPGSIPTSSASSAPPSRDTAGKPKSPSCALQAIANPVVQNGDQHGHIASRNGLPVTPEGGGLVRAGDGDTDFLDDLDHIVSLLMT